MKKLEDQIKKLEKHIPLLTKSNPNVSKASVGWQIGHSLRVIIGICKALGKSNPSDYTSSFSFKKNLCLAICWLPRGKAKSPKSTRPEGEITEEYLLQHVALARKEIKTLEDFDSNAFFNHPIFGNLNLNESKRFLNAHTYHHLKIIRDILG